jgi:hypothetical protein
MGPRVATPFPAVVAAAVGLPLLQRCDRQRALGLSAGCRLRCWLTLPPGQAPGPTHLRVAATEPIRTVLLIATVVFGYTYCYGLTAVFLRVTFIKIHAGYTWILALALAVIGSAVPYLALFLVHHGEWTLSTHYLWLLTNPGVGIRLVGDPELGLQEAALTYVSCWAVIVTVLNGPWFIGQLRRFRPYAARTAQAGDPLPALSSATPLEATRTAP